MGRKKRNNEVPSYMSTGKSPWDRKRTDTFTRIHDSVLVSPAYLDLKPSAKQLYFAMRSQEMGKRKPNRDFEENSPVWENVKGEDCFYFPLHTANRYNPSRYNTQNSKRLYNDINELIDHGFVERVISGKRTQDKSIYRYSDRWKLWERR